MKRYVNKKSPEGDFKKNKLSTTVDITSLKVLTMDFCARLPIANAILADLDKEE